MVKVTYAQLQLGAPVRVPGQYYISASKWGPIVKKWPRKRGAISSPAQRYKQWEFGLAAQESTSTDGGLFDAAIVAARDTTMLPRDFIVASAYGTIIDLTFEDGSAWTRYRDVTINAQLVLDQVTDTVGALLYRGPYGWVEIVPGSNGQYLSVVDTVPAFVTVGAPGATVPLTAHPQPIAPGAGTNCNVNSLTGSFLQLNAGTVVTGIAVYANAAAATCRVNPGLWRPNIGVGNAKVVTGPQVIGIAKGWNLLPFDTQTLIVASDCYLAGININTALFQQVNQIPAVAGWQAANALPLPDPLVVTAIAADNAKAHCWLY